MNGLNINFKTEYKTKGFVALIATIVIALILLVLVARESSSGWFARFNILGTEAKEQASSLAEGCGDQALAALLTDPLYQGDTTHTTPGGTCRVFPIEFNNPLPGMVKITTQAEVRGSFANLELTMNLNKIHTGSIPLAPTRGTLVVFTHVINDNGGAKQALDFIVHIGNASPSNNDFGGDEGGVALTLAPGIPVTANAYSVSQTLLAGYKQNLSPGCSGTIAGGEVKACVITNDDVKTTLTVIANVINDNSGTRPISDFILYIDGAPKTPGTAYTVSLGSHTASGTNFAGYTASLWGYQCNADGTININTGDNKTCIITYDDNPPAAPTCADSVMVLDRTGSVSNDNGPNPLNRYPGSDLDKERVAATSLVDLYATVPSPFPQVGAGSVGAYPNNSVLPAGAASVPVAGQLSIAYSALKTFIGNMMAGNSNVGSDLSAAINVGNAELNSARHIAGKQKVLILVSDGDPNEPSGTVTNTITLAPSAVGTYDTWTANTGSKTSAVSADDGDATYINATIQAETFGFAPVATVPANATNISVTLRAVAKETSGTTGSIQFVEENGGGLVFGSTVSLTSTYTDYPNVFATNPSGGAWTVSEVNAWTTKFGILNTSTGGTIPRVTQIYAIVNYDIPGSPKQSPAATGVSSNQWATPANAFASDNAYATDATNGHRQGYSNFGFAIPSTAIITGIQVTTEAKISGSVSQTTPTLFPNGQGNYTSWSGDESDVDETGSPDCSSGDSITENTTNDRESVNIDLGSIPNGSTVTDVTVTTYDRGDSSSGGTYKTFVRVDGTNTDAGSNLTATGTSGCNQKTQAINIPDFTKSGSTDLEVGVIKVSGNSNTVRVGAISAVVNYITPVTSGVIDIALSSNNGGAWTTASRPVSIDTAESVDSPAGNSSSDFWSRTWAPADFNNGSFALRVQNSSATGVTVSLDQVQVQVYYTVPGNSGNLAATSIGNFNNWPPNTGTALTAVSSFDQDTSYINNSIAIGQRQTFNFPGAGSVPSGATNITVTIHAFAKETSGSNGNIQLLIEDGTSQSADASHSLSSSYADVNRLMSSNPLGGAWTVSNVNTWNLKFGVQDASTGGTVPRVTRVWVEVKYNIVTDAITAALNAADTAKLSGTDIFTIHFGSDPAGYPGRELLANLATGNSPVVYNSITHQNGSLADPSGVINSDSGLVSPTVQSADTGGDGNGFEVSPANVLSDGSGSASNIDGAGDRHRFSGYNFSVIPPGASITGIQVRTDWWTDSTSGTNSVDIQLSWDGGLSWTSNKNQSTETTSDSNNKTVGGAGDTWGRTWSLAELDTNKFIVRITSNSSVSTRDFSLDWLPVRVYYTVITENGDGDYFFISPTSADMAGIFYFIGQQVCKAAFAPAVTPPPTTATINIITNVINNDGTVVPPKTAGDFTTNISAVNPSLVSSPGVASPGINVTVDPGAYSITENGMSGYIETPGANCSSIDADGTPHPITAGETRVCVLTNDDVPPAPPPPNLNIDTDSWQEVPHNP